VIATCAEQGTSEQVRSRDNHPRRGSKNQGVANKPLIDASCARIVELKLFSGLSAEKIAEVEGSSTATVTRQWRFARAWLGRLGVEVPANLSLAGDVAAASSTLLLQGS
jgi:hypothetical protein